MEFVLFDVSDHLVDLEIHEAKIDHSFRVLVNLTLAAGAHLTKVEDVLAIHLLVIGVPIELEGGQPKCLNHYESQSDSDKKIENRKFEFEERGYFGTTKKTQKNQFRNV